MPIPEQRDLEKTRLLLSAWLSERLGEEVEVADLRAPEGTGYSNETFLFEAGGRSLVLRLEPTGHRLFLEPDFAHQYEILRRLGESSDVPVPRVHWLEEGPGVLGATFYVMDRVDGRIPTDNPPYNQEGWLAESAADDRRRLWEHAVDVLARIHTVDADVSFLAKPSRGATGLDQQLDYWRESLEWAARGRPMPVAEAAWEWLSANPPSERATGLSWGDARIGNMIFDDYRCVAVLDWEMASLGGPDMDVGWWLFLDRFHSEGYGVDRLPGLGDRQETLDRYESLTGRKVKDLEFYEVFAGFRFAVIMIRLAQLLDGFLITSEDAEKMEVDNPVTQVLARLL